MSTTTERFISLTETICFVDHNSVIPERILHSYKLVICFNGSYSAVVNGEALSNVTGYLLGSNVPHSADARGASVLIYFIELEGRIGQAIRSMLGESKYIDLSSLLATDPFQPLLATGFPALQAGTIADFADEVILTLFPKLRSQPTPVLDRRVNLALSYIEANLHRTIMLKEIADLINLSPERTRHLFIEQVGAPFSEYVLWKRIKSVVCAVKRDKMDFGEAALRFGFADQSHFGRIFRRLFGCNASFLLKNLPDIQLISPSLSEEV
ncbi:helix-turn-helix domain-containing protein [Spirosoma endophyticum]|uniref:AraC-type DNA-binding protein n=1 Tax=Spirosoma endophyticum TaxID=662367 RepID=A0A1I1XHB7_9BACT|nr:AraC family transcriptional regulator [Spirosoma endophyticum]SFE06757.1 AraC-type DNA-binding protein [Spirosoma endophyticum]